jgi:Fe-S cluster biogenesis protein NfuA
MLQNVALIPIARQAERAMNRTIRPALADDAGDISAVIIVRAA